MTSLITLGLYEFLTLLKKADVPVYRLFGIVMGSVIPIIITVELGATQSGEVLFLVFGCLCLFILQFFRRENPQAIVGISLTLFAVLYVSWFPSFLIKIWYMHGGQVWIVYLILVTKIQDIGAYIVGSLIGKHSLIPHVSPKKSVEGAIAGLLSSAALSMAFAPYLPFRLDGLHLFILGIAIGVVGQIGDLSESLMKRFCNSKDSGSIFPGMGGILDVTDSVLFTAPLFYFYLQSLV